MTKRRVVVTGMGMLTPLGLTVEESWRNILAGKSGVGLIPNHEMMQTFSTRIGAFVKNFDASPFISPKDVRRMDMFIQYGIAATEEAIRDANLSINESNAHRIGAVVGSGMGGLPMIEKNHQQLLEGGPRKVSPFFIPGAIINMLAGQVSIKYGLKGPNISIVTACTTGTHNIGQAARMIAYGDADVMIAGGSEMATTPLAIAGFAACRALSTRNDEPERASRPWDRDRDGFVLGEGAGILVLEEYEHAKKRGAKIHAELAGFGMSGDAFHMTAPDETAQGATSAMENALRDAGVSAEQVDYINAHGTSTPPGDRTETIAIKKAFADHAYRLAVSSTKSMIGHLLGAAGAVEAIVTILAMRDGIAPPTINLDNPDEDCDLNFVPHEAQQRKIAVAMSNSFGFGGTNGALLFRQL